MSLAEGGNELDGPKGVTDAYRDGWEKVFGKKDEKPACAGCVQVRNPECPVCGNPNTP